MDTSDPEIGFDEHGLCNHCRYFERILRKSWMPNKEGEQEWVRWVEQISAAGRDRDYDCIIGISGGVDSAYMAYRIRRYNLRPLAVHVDGGWNTEIAVGNIERLVNHLKIDLFTYVVDWEEMRDLQLAFLKAAVVNQDVPQDHAFYAQLYRQAAEHGIKYYLSGSNISTECILPRCWGYNSKDLRHLLAIHRRFGEGPLRTFPQIGFWSTYLWNPYVRRIRTLYPLNFMEYDKPRAKKEMAEAFGWRDYGDKHHESRFTKFFQSYYLPVKFGYDKRRAHLSSMIVTGQIGRDDALRELDRPPYDPAEITEDKTYIAKKLGIAVEELERILELPARSHRDYRSNEWLFNLKDRVLRSLGSK
jgi:N-acetyl sugar amidotransferase